MPLFAFLNASLSKTIFIFISLFFSSILLADNAPLFFNQQAAFTINSIIPINSCFIDAVRTDTLVTPVTAMLYEQQYDMEHFGYDKKRKEKERKNFLFRGVALSNNYEFLTATNILLLDKRTKAKQEFKTKEDGAFYFHLKLNRKYDIAIENESGEPIVIETISTFNKKKSETIYKVLQMKRQ